MRPIFLVAAARMFKRNLQAKLFGFEQFDGSSEEICQQIITSCFNPRKKYFMVSSGHFREFYCRDFGWSARSLVELGHKKKVIETLDYALSAFERHGRIEQSISPQGRPFTFPNIYSADAIAFLVRALRDANAKSLATKHRKFIEKEARVFFRKVIDPKTGLVLEDGHFSSIKDYSVRKSSCYETCIAGMLKEDMDYFGFENPLSKFDYKSLLMEHYWNEEYFLDDLSGRQDVCGDANVFPFWCGIIKDKDVLKKAVASMQSAGLTRPFPLKYVSLHTAAHSMIWMEKFAGDYERDAIWAHIGLIYIEVVTRVDKKEARRCLAAYDNEVKKYQTFLEVYEKSGKPFQTPFYMTDEAMIWCANFLSLKKKL